MRTGEGRLVLLIFAIAIAVRLYRFGQVPPGLNQDEASLGYDAYALLKYGIDRNGFSFPVHLVSWGSGMNVLSAYVIMPFIWLFGLSEMTTRSANLLFGLLSLYFFYDLARRVAKGKEILCLFLLAIAPWHIMVSRWALEANLFPSVFLLGAYVCYFFFFLAAYFGSFPERISYDYFTSLGPAIQKADTVQGPVCVAAHVNMPYIFVLFYSRADVHMFRDTVVYDNPGSEFQGVESFGRYTFGEERCAGKDFVAYVYNNGDPPLSDMSGYELTEFRHFTAAVRK